MARNTRIIGLFLLLTVALAVFVGCKAVELKAPAPFLDGDFLCWDEITGADGYEVLIDEKYTMTTRGTVYPMGFKDTQVHFLKVRAICEDGTVGPYSSSVSYTAGKEIIKKSLSAPIITDINGNGVMSWQCSDNIFTVGYNIYIDNVYSAYVTTDGELGTAPLHYALPILENGSHNIQVQAKSGKAEFSDSLRSDIMIYQIDDGKVVISKLGKPSISFDPVDFTISWPAIRYAGSYNINIDGIDYPFVPESNSGKIQFSLRPYGTGINSVSVAAISSDSALYTDSSYSYPIEFPFPSDFALEKPYLDVGDDGKYFLSWQGNIFSEGYELVFDGLPIVLSENRYSLDGIVDGIHSCKVRSIAVGGFFTNSYFSEEVSFELKDGKIMMGRLEAPQNLLLASVYTSVQIGTREEPKVDYTAEHHFVWDDVEGAETYTLTVIDANNPISVKTYQTTESVYKLDAGFGERFYVSIKATGEGYMESGESEMVFCGCKTDTCISAPTSVYWTVSGFSWDGTLDENQVYEYIYNGNIYKTKSNILTVENFTEGFHSFKVRIVEENDTSLFDSPYSEECTVDFPIVLDTPSITLRDGTLEWTAVKNAVGYRLYCGSEIILDGAKENGVKLSPLFDYDGSYLIYVQAIGEFPFASSLMSSEVKYVKDDTPVGTKEKPAEIHNLNDFMNMVEHPDYYYSIKVNTLDFESKPTAPLFGRDNPFCGTILGNGCVLKNVNIVSNGSDSIGLFGATAMGNIFDLNIQNISVTVADDVNVDYVGALIGYAEESVVKNVSVDGRIKGNSAYLGGVVGYFGGEISNVKFFGTFDISSAYAGGVVGYLIGNAIGLQCEILNNTILQNKGNYTGGVVGLLLNGNISKSTFKGGISSSGKYIGGIAGFSQGNENTITQCEVFGNISTPQDNNSYCVGGINGGMIGQLVVSDCAYEGNIASGTFNNRVGGISGMAFAVNKSVFIGDITSGGRVGGVSALCSEITQCIVRSSIKGIGELCKVGGFVSYGCKISNCLFEGKITAEPGAYGDFNLLAYDLTEQGAECSSVLIDCVDFSGTLLCTDGEFVAQYVYICGEDIFENCANLILPLENLPEGFGEAWILDEDGRPILIRKSEEESL